MTTARELPDGTLRVRRGCRLAIAGAMLVTIGSCSDDNSLPAAPEGSAPPSSAGAAISAAVSTTESAPTTSSPAPQTETVEGLTISAAMPFGTIVAASGGSFVMVRVDPGASNVEASVATSVDGVEWTPVESDLDLASVIMATSDGLRVVALGSVDAFSNQLSMSMTTDGGTSWTPLPPFPTTASTVEYSSTSLNVTGLAMSTERIVMVATEMTNFDWRAYATEVLGQDHGFVTGMSQSDPSSLTVSFEDGYELTVDPTSLGIEPMGAFPSGPTVFVFDGETWVREEPDGWAMGMNQFPVASGPAGFVVIGQLNPAASGGTGTGSIMQESVALTSTDGLSWTAHELPNVLESSTPSVTGGPLGYALVGNDVVYHSVDAVTWEEVYRFEDLDPDGIVSMLTASGAGGAAGFVIPIFDLSTPNSSTGRLLQSRDGRSWTMVDLASGTEAAAAAVGEQMGVVVPLSMGGPGGPGGSEGPSATLPEDDGELREVIAAAFTADLYAGAPDGPERLGVTISDSEALCIADGVIEGLGVDRLRELNFGVYPFYLLGYGLSFPIDVPDADVIIDTIADCATSWKWLLIVGATQGTDLISEETAACIESELDDDLAAEIMVTELARPYDDVGGAGSPDLSHLTPLVDAFDRCATDQELNAIDWN